MPVLTFPKAFVYISRPYSAAHPAIDLGWGATVGGATAPLLSPGDGRVAAVADGCGWDRARGWGNYIRIDHGDGFETLLAHCLRGSFTVKKGDSVSRGQAVCRMGNSGNCFTANDYHCHYVVLRGGCQVDPLLYTRLDESFQTVYDKTDSAYTIARLAANDAARCRVERDAARQQLEVYADRLRLRAAPGLAGEILGYVPTGFYDVDSVFEQDGYRWCRIGGELYAAVCEGYSRLHAPASRERQLEDILSRIAALAAAAKEAK